MKDIVFVALVVWAILAVFNSITFWYGKRMVVTRRLKVNPRTMPLPFLDIWFISLQTISYAVPFALATGALGLVIHFLVMMADNRVILAGWATTSALCSIVIWILQLVLLYDRVKDVEQGYTSAN